MTVEPNLLRPEEHSQVRARPQAPPVPPDDAIPLAGDIQQPPKAGTAVPVDTRSPFSFGRLRPSDLLAGIASFLVLISLFLPWYSFAAYAHGKYLRQQRRGHASATPTRRPRPRHPQATSTRHTTKCP